MTEAYKKAAEAADEALEALQAAGTESFHNAKTWEEYCNQIRPIQAHWCKLYAVQLSLVTSDVLELTPNNDIGDYFSIPHFKEMCDCGGFIDSDGYGTFCHGEHLTQFVVHPSLFKEEVFVVPECLDGVMWYNK